MGNKIPQQRLQKGSVILDSQNYLKDKVRCPSFSFSDFKMHPINIERKFNNFYKDNEMYLRIISTLFAKGLPLLSNETVEELIDNPNKQDAFHFHKIKGKENIIKLILTEYQFPSDRIDDMMEGNRIYQFEIPYENGTARVILEVIDSIFNLLFIDTNHHIYFDAEKVQRANSLYFDECPINELNCCYRMNNLHTCFAFEFLDIEKIIETYGYEYYLEIK